MHWHWQFFNSFMLNCSSSIIQHPLRGTLLLKHGEEKRAKEQWFLWPGARQELSQPEIHSDIFAWARADTDTCPYPHGTPLKTHLFEPYVEESPAEEPIAEEPIAEEWPSEEPVAEELPIDELPAEPEYPSAGPKLLLRRLSQSQPQSQHSMKLAFSLSEVTRKAIKRRITCRWGRLKGMRRYPQQRAPIHNRSRLKIPMVFLPPSRNLRKMTRA
jgi:hypothetical protein